MRISIIPGSIKDGTVSLRPLNIFDGPFLKRMLQEKDVLISCGSDTPFSACWISLWLWMRKRYDLIYIIEYQSERAGIIGLYNLTPGRTAELSLVIPDNKKRLCGIGSRAFNLLWGILRKSPLFMTVKLRVKKYNSRALSFWEGLGFEKNSVSDDEIILSLNVIQDG